jgi:predicted unusual protein kinase regulating ubiquinone biosynthesis (AarF/ABC1/UbiB family)
MLEKAEDTSALMKISLRPEHLKRYKDLAALFMKYGRSDLLGDGGVDGTAPPAAPEAAEKLTCDLETLGPTYVKLGQLLSTRADLLPPAFLEALSRLQDKVGPFPYPEAEAIVTAELGVRISKAFATFDEKPLAAASLGQVHRATLRDGRAVVVKVQRPGIQATIAEDLAALEEIAAFVEGHSEVGRQYQLVLMIDEFRKSILRELDYRQEGRNLVTLGHNLREFDRIVVPAPIEGYTTSRVLTTTYVRGVKITSLSPLARTELDGSALAEQLFRAYLQQILVDGFVHADPHPGNVFVTEDDRIALLDLGMVAHVSPGMQEKLLQLLLAVSEGRSDDAADVAIEIGETTGRFDEHAFRRRVGDLVAQTKDASVGQIEVGKIVLLLARMSGESGIRVPSELMMLGKTLLNLDQVGRALDPSFDPNASIRRNAADLTRHRLRKSLSPANLLAGLMEVKEFAERLPGRINRILDTIASNNLEVKVDAIDEKLLIEGIQKIANRITVGLILAALIVSAAMLMRVETTFRILGYPGLAILFFLAAAGGGVALMVNILLSDRRGARKAHTRERA